MGLLCSLLEPVGKRPAERFRGGCFPAAPALGWYQARTAQVRSRRCLAGGQRFGGVWSIPKPSAGAPSCPEVSGRRSLPLRDAFTQGLQPRAVGRVRIGVAVLIRIAERVEK